MTKSFTTGSFTRGATGPLTGEAHDDGEAALRQQEAERVAA